MERGEGEHSTTDTLGRTSSPGLCSEHLGLSLEGNDPAVALQVKAGGTFCPLAWTLLLLVSALCFPCLSMAPAHFALAGIQPRDPRCLEVNTTLLLFTSDYRQTGAQLLHGLGLVSERVARSHLKGPLLVPQQLKHWRERRRMWDPTVRNSGAWTISRQSSPAGHSFGCTVKLCACPVAVTAMARKEVTGKPRQAAKASTSRYPFLLDILIATSRS